MKTQCCWIVICLLWCLGAAHADTLNYWRFEEGNGGYVADEVGGITGGLVGNGGWPWSVEVPAATVPLTGAANNGSLYCGGVWLDITTPQTMVLGLEFTIEFFFNAVMPESSYTFFGLSNGSSLGASMGQSSGELFFVNGFQGFLISAPTDLVQLNSWQHYALVKEPGEYSIFIDGQLQFNTALPPGTDGPYIFGGSAVRDGSRSIGNGFYGGYLDEFRISDTALMPSQFLNASIPEPSTLGLMLLGATGLAWRKRRKRGSRVFVRQGDL